MLSIFKKPLAYILTGSFSFILAACYGAPVDYTYKAVKTIDKTGNPLSNLKVELRNNGVTEENQESNTRHQREPDDKIHH